VAGKYALYLPYKIYTATADTATDAEFGAFIRALLRYDMDDTEPKFTDRAFSMLFESVRPEMDYYHKKYDALVAKRREAGKRGGASQSQKKVAAARENGRAGGAPEGNQNAAKSKPDESGLNENSEEEKTIQPKQRLGLISQKTTQAESE
jgi:hypothetical protein